MIMKWALSPCENSDIDVYLNAKLSDLEYADNVVLLSEDVCKLQAFLNCLNGTKDIFGMHIASLKGKISSEDCTGSKLNLVLAE